MPHHKACEKHLRASAKRTLRNRAARASLRTAIKKVRLATDKSEGEAALRSAYSIIDKNAKSGLIHPNNAANQKSKLTRHVTKIGD